MNRNDSIVSAFGLGVFLLMMVIAVVGGSNSAGSTPPPYNPYWFAGKPLQTETKSASGDLAEGASDTVALDMTGRLVRNITATLTWQDETDPPARRLREHTNNPDSFTMVITNGNQSDSASGANPQDGEGSLTAGFSFTDQELAQLSNASWTVTITMDNAGIWLPKIGVGVIGLTDPGNAYSLSVGYEYYDEAGTADGDEG